MTLEELNQLYSQKSTQIVKDREAGLFKTPEEDGQAQRDVWLWYLDEKVKITDNQKDHKALTDYLKELALGKYQDTRDNFHHHNKISRETYEKETLIAFEWLEDELVKRGYLDASKKTSVEKKMEFLQPAWVDENEYVKTHKTKKSRVMDIYEVCETTGVIVGNYFKLIGI